VIEAQATAAEAQAMAAKAQARAAEAQAMAAEAQARAAEAQARAAEAQARAAEAQATAEWTRNCHWHLVGPGYLMPVCKTGQDQKAITHHLQVPWPWPGTEFTLSKRRTMLNSISTAAGRLVLLNISQPSRLRHGLTELISQIVDLFSNCSTFVHPNVVRKTEINQYLSTQLQ
jgi:multidrug efflux pump subunit AcrA (membrane-fusion protein)